MFSALRQGSVVYILENDGKLSCKTAQVTSVSSPQFNPANFAQGNFSGTINISVNGAGLSEIALPENSEVLAEMSLEGNNFTEFDLSKYPALRIVALSSNKLTSIDFSKAPNLEVASASYNQLTEVKFGNNNLLQ